MLVLATAYALTLSTLEPTEIVFRFNNLDNGIVYENSDSTTMNTQFGGVEQTVKSSSVTTNKISLVSTNPQDDTLVISSKIIRMKSKVSQPGLTIEFDTESDEFEEQLKTPAVAAMAAPLGLEIHLELQEDGTVLGAPNTDDIVDFILEVEDPATMQALAPFMDEETIVGFSKANYEMLPTSPVEVGEKWNRLNEIPFGNGVVVTINTIYTFTGTENTNRGEIALIDVDGSMSINLAMGDVSAALEESSMTGEMSFNLSGGYVERFTLESSFVMVFSSALNEDNETARISMTQSATQRLIEE